MFLVGIDLKVIYKNILNNRKARVYPKAMLAFKLHKNEICNIKITRIKINKAKATFTGRCPRTHPSRTTYLGI
jgi:hypothetical protein